LKFDNSSIFLYMISELQFCPPSIKAVKHCRDNVVFVKHLWTGESSKETTKVYILTHNLALDVLLIDFFEFVNHIYLTVFLCSVDRPGNCWPL